MLGCQLQFLSILAWLLLPGVARQQVTFLVLPRKVTKRSRPRCSAPTGFPRYFTNKRGCATRPGGAHKPCPTAELKQCSPEPPLVCEISRRRTGEKKFRSKWGGHRCPRCHLMGMWALCAHIQKLWVLNFALPSHVPSPSSGGGPGNSDEYV